MPDGDRSYEAYAARVLDAEPEAGDAGYWGFDPEPVDGCTVCEGPLIYLGRLGRREHFTCRDCGMGQSRTTIEL